MKKIFATLATLLLTLSAYAQPTSVRYEKEHDFFMNVLANPTFRLYDFLRVGLSSKNMEFLEYSVYCNSSNAQEECQNANVDMLTAYKKVAAAWRVFLEIENRDISEVEPFMLSFHRNNYLAPRVCPDPELKYKLSIVPLKLVDY